MRSVKYYVFELNVTKIISSIQELRLSYLKQTLRIYLLLEKKKKLAIYL